MVTLDSMVRMERIALLLHGLHKILAQRHSWGACTVCLNVCLVIRVVLLDALHLGVNQSVTLEGSPLEETQVNERFCASLRPLELASLPHL